jgi:SP family general alpha glucoside:H+ symporter-like MFS transporter
MMHHTNEIEKAAAVGSTFFDCFKGVNLRRTEIACIVWLIQTTCGSPLMGSATYFLQSAGLADDTASTLNLIMFVVGGVGTVSSWFLMKPFGRRTLYLVGECILAGLMLITAILGTIHRTEGTGLATGALLIIFTFVYDITVGPVCYSLVAEMGSTRLRSKTVVLARNLYNVGGVVVGFLNPYMLNPSACKSSPGSVGSFC